MPGVNIQTPSVDNESEVTSVHIAKKEINVDEVSGRSCYFSLAGDLAFKAFENKKFSTFEESAKNKRLKEAFRQRINFAVLMFDHVVMHCSDPLRTEIVLEVLEEKTHWIEEGRILFIFSNSIKNIRQDYSGYIARKINEYQGGYYSQKEAESLRKDHMTPEYYQRVIDLLDKTPFIVRKSAGEEFSFGKLVLDDLSANQQEQVIIDSEADLTQILSLSLSLYQLMHIMKYQTAQTDGVDEYVFPNKTAKKVIKAVKSHLKQDNTMARVAIVDSLKDELRGQELTDTQEDILDAISLRMDVLYCHMNSGKQMILEFHPSYEYRSMYQIECFSNFVNKFSKSNKKVKLNDSIINKILKDSDLQAFRLCYLVSMADTHEHINLDQHDFSQRTKKTLDIFNEVSQNNINSLFLDRFESIREALNGA